MGSDAAEGGVDTDWLAAKRATFAAAVERLCKLRGIDSSVMVDIDGWVDDSLAQPRLVYRPEGLSDFWNRFEPYTTKEKRGAFYTPQQLAYRLCELTLDGWVPCRMLDPTCGAGVFLASAVRYLVDIGVPADDALFRVAGVDIDSDAVAVANTMMRCVAAEYGVDVDPGYRWVVCADSLLNDSVYKNVDCVIGNPPFIGQTRQKTKFAGSFADMVSTKFADVAVRLTNAASLFLYQAVKHVEDGGKVCLILPARQLSNNHSRKIRRYVDSMCVIERVWHSDMEHCFEGALVDTSALVLKKTRERQCKRVEVFVKCDMRRWGEVDVADDADWASYICTSERYVTDARPETSDLSLDDIADVRVDIFDVYYLLSDAVEEADGREVSRQLPMLITVGVIEPGWHLWGRVASTVHRRKFSRPVVDMAKLIAADASNERFINYLQPKIVMGSQTNIVELVVDTDGVMLPLPPTCFIVPKPHPWWGGDIVGGLRRLAAVLLAPVVTSMLQKQLMGSGASSDLMRISTPVLESLKLPMSWSAVDEAVGLLERFDDGSASYRDIVTFASVSDRIWGVSDSELEGRWASKVWKIKTKYT